MTVQISFGQHLRETWYEGPLVLGAYFLGQYLGVWPW